MLIRTLLVLLVAVLLASYAGEEEPLAFDRSFDEHEPSAPLNIGGLAQQGVTEHDITTVSRDSAQWGGMNANNPLVAHHAADCGSPNHDGSGNRELSPAYEERAFLCAKHLMFTILAGGYGAIYYLPDHLVDFTDQAAVVEWDMSTLHTGGPRDWFELSVIPWGSNFIQANTEVGLQGLTEHGILIDGRDSQGDGDPEDDGLMLVGYKVKDFALEHVPGGADAGTGPTLGINHHLTACASPTDPSTTCGPSAKNRYRFRLTIFQGGTGLRLEVPALGLVWEDASFTSGALPFTQGLAMWSGHSYNPRKFGFTENTWHVDELHIEPAVPFGIIHGDTRRVRKPEMNTADGHPIMFDSPAPANAALKFVARATDADGNPDVIEVETDADPGVWTAVAPVPTELQRKTHHYPYWVPIPEGAQTVRVRLTGDVSGKANLVDPAIYSLASAPTPTPTPTATATPIPTPTPTPTPMPTPSSTPEPTCTLEYRLDGAPATEAVDCADGALLAPPIDGK